MLTFISPLWSIGFLGAVGLPVAAHLLSRTRYLPAEFPATRFVAQAVLETTRIDRPRHVLLLLLRVLALAAVVAAFMQPRWQRDVFAHVGQGVCVVVIIDASASMQRSDRGATLFDQARLLADEQLAGLDPATDTAWVILVGRSPRTLLPEPGANLSELRSRLQSAECTYESDDLQGAIDLAESVLAEQDRAGRIIVISDGQAASRPARGLATHLSGLEIEEHTLGPAAQGNVAVQLLDAAPYPPTAGLPVTLTVALRNYGSEDAEVALSAEGGGGSADRSLTLQAGATLTHTIQLTPQTPGGAVFRIQAAAGDGFPYDDETGFFTEVRSAQRIVVFTSDFEQSGDAAISRIGLALSPDDNASRYDLAIADPAGFEQAAGYMDDPSACWIVCGATRFSEGFAEGMRRHLDAGGGMLWIADSNASAAAMDGMAGAPLDWRGGAASAGVVASARFDHDVLRVFEGPARASVVGLPLAGVAPADVRNDASVLLATADGRPVLVMRRVGHGQCAVLNASIDPARSDFASLPVFVPLINELVRYLAPGPAVPMPLHPGDRLPSVLHGPELQRPAGASSSPVDTAQLPGPYLALDSAGQPIAGQWVGLDPAESDLTQARAATGGPSGKRVHSATGMSGMTNRKGLALWPYLIAAALLLIVAESSFLLMVARREARA